MSKEKLPRASEARALRFTKPLQLRSRSLIVASIVTLGSAGCSEDEEPTMTTLGPVLGVDASVPGVDSGFAQPVFMPPPDGGTSSLDARADTSLPPITTPSMRDANTPAIDASGMSDANMPSLDSGARDAMTASDGSMQLDPAASNPCGDGPEPLANIRVNEIALYQTVKIPLYKSNAWVTTRNAAVVQGKKTLIRAFVEPQTGYSPHPLRAVLTLDTEGKKTALAAERTIMRASTDEAADSTFDFQVDGALISGSTQISVAVMETTCMPPGANSTGARVPATGAQALNADGIGKLKVVVVPVTLGGRTPDTSEAQLQKMRDALRAYYPVADVEVTARAPVTYSGTAASSGTGWSQILSLVGTTRRQDAPAGNVYYFGIMNPAASFREYCRTGCVLGLAPLTSTVSRANQIGLGVGFVDNNTITTMVHELGHAHGLPHAPCTRGGTIQGADQRFPYSGAKIGSWGWDSRANKLLSPATYVDIMSYCEPEWISDYNYTKLVTRSKAVNNLAFVYNPGPVVTWQGIILHADGSVRWSGMSTDEQPGETSRARALDAQGHLVREIEVVRISLSHSDDAFLYLPEPEPSWAAIDLGDRSIVLADIAQPAK